ncbi:MAG: MarR family transcriptional regulator [Defluviitoga tunisiensis]|jgi:DNA-binding MarR family transcriptional regulator|uniref:MarR family transcriptional regulator n=1 Tax=Defluviitoga tunisiensis TaxID=1006576 RepID=A0A0C7P025_DEFTU|nr:MarR family transcriptional regulator [Defluviitoga tunisiensis]MDD3600798.1 MarR family transcriptional regulator [Defluviitoga tunisiensis]MDY0379981.1 MarR family transcriptional regulator [Defluviitoga tunisiensis]CEP77369.1 MarR family transcriptional regulator [Defluviitoga tunisiensis]HOK16477.1 MarR family transcriptional regulator [Defluviitoga tunisiensis]HOL86624.1 MarR family transcriptional regulator [Defluviitoga tunisiensis]
MENDLLGQPAQMEKLIREICSKIKSEGRKVLKDFDISPAQFDVMQIIYFRGPKMLSDISKRLGITKSTTTGIVSRLETMGYLTKEKSPEDRRVYMVNITQKGKNIIEEVIETRVKLIEKVYNKLGDKVRTIEILNEINKIMNETKLS